MKLNIYEKKRIVKTYEADTYELEFGVLEDVAEAVNLDELNSGSDAEMLKVMVNTVMNSMGTVKNLLKDIFEGITEEEIKHARVTEIARVLLDVVKYTIEQLQKGISSKN